ncbi:XRE family transcriptional regulator [Polaromonas sp.]|uniref:helix-turn-helix domain-containing protein n=1 Tax=Polaromonas sp. TaxID=1869339 RepID=UPI0032638DBB
MTTPRRASTPAVGDRPNPEAMLGPRLRRLRATRSWTLEQASEATGLARSTLSKIENSLMSPTYEALTKLAAGFRIDISELFSNGRERIATGRRSISRKGEGQVHRTKHYEYHLLCNDLSHKIMTPLLTRIVARKFEDFDDWSRHDGEEFMFVLSGEIELFTEFYSSERFEQGESWYIDSRMGHRIISVSDEDAMVLWMSTMHPNQQKSE